MYPATASIAFAFAAVSSGTHGCNNSLALGEPFADITLNHTAELMMVEKQRAHSDKLKAREIDADGVMVRFSPSVLRSFARLEAMVHNSEHYDSDMLLNLQDLTSGKPISLDFALLEMVRLAEQAQNHIHATNDTRAESALDDLCNALAGDAPDKKPVTVLLLKARAARGNVLQETQGQRFDR
jgi:hypothetical protein